MGAEQGATSLFGEPQIDLAIAFEEHAHQAAGEAEEPELVSRAVQSTLGLLTGIVVYGCALGGPFALAFAYAYGRIGRLGSRAKASILAAAGVLILVPQVKYPANPPSVGEPETVGLWTTLGLVFGGLAERRLASPARWRGAAVRAA